MLNSSQQGVALYLGIIIMTIILAIALGLSVISIGQLKMAQQMGDSVRALYAADSGIEEALKDTTPVATYSNSFGTDYFYNVDVYCSPSCDAGICAAGPNQTDAGCNASYFCYKSVGTYREIKRAIEIER